MAGYKAKVTGYYGRLTFDRVRTFEYQEQIKVDGIVEKTDARAIYKAARNGPSGGVSFNQAPPQADLPPVPGAKAKLLSDGTAVLRLPRPPRSSGA